jgi:translation initiation factor 4B
LSPSAEGPREGGRRFEGAAPREHRPSPAWGEGRPEGAAPRREFQPSEGRPQYERQPTAGDLDNQWRSKMRPDAASPTGTPDDSTPSSPAPQTATLASRPKLNLAKRTVSEAQPAPSSAASDKPNPFGAARPIDTAAREKEIEEKQKLAVQQKKEADDKAREEKKAKEAAAKEASSKEEDSEEKPRADTEALSKEGEAGEADVQDENANGEIVDDKAVKPQEVVRDPPKSEGSWRRKSSTPAEPAAGTTTETLDEDGWSTVTKPVKNARNTRRGGAPTRAIAS